MRRFLPGAAHQWGLIGVGAPNAWNTVKRWLLLRLHFLSWVLGGLWRWAPLLLLGLFAAVLFVAAVRATVAMIIVRPAACDDLLKLWGALAAALFSLIPLFSQKARARETELQDQPVLLPYGLASGQPGSVTQLLLRLRNEGRGVAVNIKLKAESHYPYENSSDTPWLPRPILPGEVYPPFDTWTLIRLEFTGPNCIPEPPSGTRWRIVVGCEFESATSRRWAVSYLLQSGGAIWQVGPVSRIGWFHRYLDCDALAHGFAGRYRARGGPVELVIEPPGFRDAP